MIFDGGGMFGVQCQLCVSGTKCDHARNKDFVK